MNQRQIYRTIETIASGKFESTEDLLRHVINQVILKEEIRFKGGRIWKLSPSKKSYRLIYQVGDIEKIEDGFSIRVSEDPIFLQAGKQKTLTKPETNKYLRKKGIIKYSITGIGERIKVDGNYLYPYLLAFNTPEDYDEGSVYTLNIIGSAVTTVLSKTRAEEKTKRMEKELDKAREIQKSILPEHELNFGNYEIFGISMAEQVVGGDFFDYLDAGEESDRVTVVIGDAASKGLSAAIQALYVSGAIRMGTGFSIKISTLLRKVNNLVHRTFPHDRFVTLFIADIIDNKKGLCVFANAGHNYPLFYKQKDDNIEQLSSTGPALGLAPNQSYKIENVNLSKGDILLLYTDGISEAMDTEYRQFGEERLSEALRKHKDENAKQICQNLLQEVLNYSRRSPYSDDKTLVVIKRMK